MWRCARTVLRCSAVRAVASACASGAVALHSWATAALAAACASAHALRSRDISPSLSAAATAAATACTQPRTQPFR